MELFPEPDYTVNEIAQWMKVIAVKPDDLSSILRPHMVEEQKQLP